MLQFGYISGYIPLLSSGKEPQIARPLRIEYKGAFYHVTGRENDRRESILQNLIMINPKTILRWQRLRRYFSDRLKYARSLSREVEKAPGLCAMPGTALFALAKGVAHYNAGFFKRITSR